MRKCFKIFSIIVLFISASLLLFSCDDSLTVDSSSLTTTYENTIRGNLLEYALVSDYKRSEAEKKDEVKVFISSFDANSSDHNFKIVKAESIDVFPEYNIKIDIFDITDKTNEKKCFVLIPNDIRLGSVFYMSDSGHWKDYISEDDLDLDLNSREFFYQVIIEPFTEQVKKVFDVWKTISEKEIEKERKKYFGNTRDFSVNSLRVAYGPYELKGSDVFLNSNQWGQESYYNDAIEKVYGKNYLAGCGPIAISIIASCLRWPESFVEYTGYGRKATLSELKQAWPEHEDWDGKYDWDAINNGDQFQTAALIFNVAETMTAMYGLTGTGVYSTDIGDSLTRLGFEWKFDGSDSLDSGKILNVVSCLEKGVPVSASGISSAGEGHSFVIDGAKVTSRTRSYRKYNIGKAVSYTDVVSNEITDEWYHCNLGWYGRSNGWCKPDSVGGFDTSIIYYDIAIK